ncbi:hypothetical protein COT99_02700 [Candidatus Falkowbacteria bacterium CG10_big_fil_rev_8_21_14_0_10_43_10]|uniref:DUF2178 domain-containing protein n=1 Tax=Candidatus Falkowbacteria bacterium CG10_big_fil_rev_8_21_14_0_10_43_10 TaxID=1974567 RepID=A0A2H0V1Y2_9BACT|nr:MAG: hypothetical protein COT99_02700 [Candidatus Falkowbacteria bacterium CG10_big_fil_rev_8_21_14_0_10_43_10]
MTLKQFKVIKLIIVIILAVVIGLAVARENFLVPVMAIGIAIAALQILRGKAKEIMADERDYEVGGKAARLAIRIFSWFAIIVMLFLYANRSLNPSYEAVAITLAYSVCFLMLLYTLIFHYYSKFSLLAKKKIYLIIGFVIIVILALAGLRLFSGEDDWLCQNGQWVMHGHPDFPAPITECRK